MTRSGADGEFCWSRLLYLEGSIMKKMLFIYNPKAGKEQIRNKLADILDVFTKGGYEITT